FTNPPAQCGPLNRQIGQMRSDLERMQNQLQQVQGGTLERAEQRRSLLISLANQGCGDQYRSAALAGQQRGFFDRLFGNTPPATMMPPGQQQQQQGGTYRTICVRTCDGYYYPISFATTPDHFRADEQTCQRTCPAAEVSLYTYHNPGEDVQQAVSLNGRLYTELPTAFHYRQAIDPACSCRKLGRCAKDPERQHRRTGRHRGEHRALQEPVATARFQRPADQGRLPFGRCGQSAAGCQYACRQQRRRGFDEAKSANRRPDFPARALNAFCGGPSEIHSAACRQKSKASAFTSMPVTSDTSGAGSAAPPSRNRFVIG